MSAPTRATGFTGVVALAAFLSITNSANVNRTRGASQALWDWLVEDAAWRSAALATRCLIGWMSRVARTSMICAIRVLHGWYRLAFRCRRYGTCSGIPPSR